ncbi:hypothetical protein V6N13_109544 [Hibiscus sabdariffa]|uniref:Uncharacterized protein n=1 Tax=Hibiscus sabdariffa TaxID=183260 RepID=A0ABR2FPV9_9ROSI
MHRFTTEVRLKLGVTFGSSRSGSNVEISIEVRHVNVAKATIVVDPSLNDRVESDIITWLGKEVGPPSVEKVFLGEEYEDFSVMVSLGDVVSLLLRFEEIVNEWEDLDP